MLDSLDIELNRIPTEFACLENIRYQHNSKLPKALDELWIATFAFVKKYNADHGISGTTGVKGGKEAKAKHLAIQKYMRKEITPKFKKIVKQYTGLVVDDVINTLPTSLENSLMIFCWFSNADQAMMEVIQASQGYSTDQGMLNPHGEVSKIDDVIDELDDFAGSLDKNAGRVMKNISRFRLKIGIPISLFVFPDWIAPNLRNQEFTPKEITAVVLHEIHHVFGYVAHMGDLAYVNRYGNNILASVDNVVKNDPKKAGQLIKKLAKKNKKMKISNKVIDKYVHTLSETDEEEYGEDLILPKVVLKLVMNLMLAYQLYINAAGVLGKFMVNPFVTEAESKEMNSATYRSRSKNMTMYERLADEGVARYGYSKHLNRALMKLNAVIREVQVSGEDPGKFTWWMRNNYLHRLGMIVSNLPTYYLTYMIGIVNMDNTPYERMRTRLRRNIENTRNNLNNKQLPPEARKQILKELDQMIEEYDNDHAGKMHHFLDLTNKFFFDIIPWLIDGSDRVINKSGDIWSTYGSFLEEIDTLLSNRGHEISARVRGIVDKRSRR